MAKEPREPEYDEEDEAEEDEEERPLFGGLQFAAPVAVWLAVGLLAVTTYALLRVAGEQRYQSCVAAATARTGLGTDSLSRLARLRAVDRCSHSPF